MKLLSLLFILCSSFFLFACTVYDPNKNQAYLKQANPSPLVRPCDKIKGLINEYDNDFERIKLKAINNRISKIWQAKYHLVGHNCQVWAWGNNSTTYSCNINAPDQETAQTYFEKAKEITRNCLSDDWQMSEQKRKKDKGLKVEFTQTNNDLTIATHLVPTAALFKSEWAVYYYVGSSRQPH
jgi:hypothetical protein|tara:strand:+ start:173 stop:718 length:546 start_codon:yes stop_codon:yes gene_type:complete